VTLVADYNQGLSLGEALDRCRALDAEGLAWIEEPLRYDDLDGHARLAAGLAWDEDAVAHYQAGL